LIRKPHEPQIPLPAIVLEGNGRLAPIDEVLIEGIKHLKK